MERTLSESEDLVISTILKNAENGGKDFQLYTLSDAIYERSQKKWQPQTVSTFIKRISAKEINGHAYLSFYKEGRFTYYHPELSMREYKDYKIKDLLSLCFNDIEDMKDYISKY
ncbi:MAG: BlaI/MecI/CopY family transcriptional regulator [Parabacteroides sp.]|nr:BlaI/MecI/CopY family transcriptional regulator [Parabacteroides sp.]